MYWQKQNVNLKFRNDTFRKISSVIDIVNKLFGLHCLLHEITKSWGTVSNKKSRLPTSFVRQAQIMYCPIMHSQVSIRGVIKRLLVNAILVYYFTHYMVRSIYPSFTSLRRCQKVSIIYVSQTNRTDIHTNFLACLSLPALPLQCRMLDATYRAMYKATE